MAEKSPELPEDLIINEILPHLTAESVLRCRCVSKPWRHFLSSPEFVKAHLKRHLDDSESVLLKDYSDYSFHVATDLAGDNAASRPADFSFYKPGQLRLHAGSCHGLVLFSRTESDTNMILMNPITLETREIPKQPISVNTKWGFGYDSYRYDFKIAGLDMNKMHIYSLKTETWRSYSYLPHHYRHYSYGGDSGMFANGRIHWTVVDPSSSDGLVIAAFFLAGEGFKMIQFPVNVAKRRSQLAAVDGCLAVAVDGADEISLDVWVMKKIEHGDSWVHFFAIKDCYSFRPLDVVCHLGGDEILAMHQRRRRLAIYSSRDGDWKDLATAAVGFPVFQAIPFRASLLSPNRVFET